MSLPIKMGGELVGQIAQLGADVSDFEPGEALEWFIPGLLPNTPSPGRHTWCAHRQTSNAAQEAALPLAGSTARPSMFDEAGVVAGQRLLITDSSGGVGSLAVQFVKARGAHVTAVASARNEEFVRIPGADEFKDY